MGQKEPLKITLSGIICWIFGLFFILIALGMIIEYEYFSAIFWFLAAFVSLSPISNLIESKLNISVSGAVRLLVVIILLAGSIAVYDSHTSSGSSSKFYSESHSTTQDDNVNYWDWKWYEISHIGDTKVPRDINN
jgi:hypothetical protein